VKLRGLLFLLAFLPAAGAARTVEFCPSLPADSSLYWEFQNGTDSISCEAVRTSDKKHLLRVYLGNHPDFVPDPATPGTHGVVGGYAATWHGATPTPDRPYILATVVLVPGGRPDLPLKAYVRVLPQLRSDLPLTVSTIAKLRFKSRW
jgi:hypothetical protein